MREYDIVTDKGNFDFEKHHVIVFSFDEAVTSAKLLAGDATGASIVSIIYTGAAR